MNESRFTKVNICTSKTSVPTVTAPVLECEASASSSQHFGSQYVLELWLLLLKRGAAASCMWSWDPSAGRSTARGERSNRRVHIWTALEWILPKKHENTQRYNFSLSLQSSFPQGTDELYGRPSILMSTQPMWSRAIRRWRRPNKLIEHFAKTKYRMKRLFKRRLKGERDRRTENREDKNRAGVQAAGWSGDKSKMQIGPLQSENAV